MSHSCHNHDHSNRESKNLGVVFLLNFSFAIIEFIGGILSQSTALIADAVHDMGDALAIAFAWAFSKIAQKKRSKSYSYGYKRFSLLSALISSLILIFGAAVMFFIALERINQPREVHGEIMFIFAVFGVLVNGFAVWKIKSGKTMNEKVISLHLLEDFLGWVVVLLASILIYFTGWSIIDPILTIGISIWIFIHGLKNGATVAHFFLQGTPADIDEEQLTKALNKIKNVASVHDLHIWSLDGESNIGSCHIITKANSNTDTLKQKIRDCFERFHVQHVTIELENPLDTCPHQQC